jgi:hypothetical protein
MPLQLPALFSVRPLGGDRYELLTNADGDAMLLPRPRRVIIWLEPPEQPASSKQKFFERRKLNVRSRRR